MSKLDILIENAIKAVATNKKFLKEGKGQDAATDLILKLRRTLYPKLSDMELDEFKKEMVQHFDAELKEAKQGSSIAKRLREDTEYQKFFKQAMEKYDINSPADLKDPERKKSFFDYIDKNYSAKNEAAMAFQTMPGFEPAVNKIKSVMQTFFQKLERAPRDVQRDFAQMYNSIIGNGRRLTKLELEKIVDVLEPVLTSAGFNLKLKNQELTVALTQALKQTKNLQSKVPATVLKEDYFPTTGSDEPNLRDAKKALAKWFMNTMRNPNTPSGQASAGTLGKQQLDILHDLIDDYALAYAQDYMDNIDMERNTF